MDIKFSSNLFLSVEELNRFKSSLGEKGWKRFVKSIVSQFGIAVNENNTNFIPLIKSGVSETITIQPGIAFDSDVNAIVLDSAVDINLPASQISGDTKYWIILRYASTHNEEGTVNISSSGALTGVGTKFKEVLRGQPDFPTKVKFSSSANTGEYEVVEVSSDTSATLAGSFTTESNKKYSVVGTFTPGFIPLIENKQIYEYDSCEIEVVKSIDTPSLQAGKEFVIATVNYVAGVMDLDDVRYRYYLNQPYEQRTEEEKKLAVDGLVSLVRGSIVSINEKGVLMEYVMQHGFRITGFNLNRTVNGYTLDIEGNSNFIKYPSTPAVTIPEHMFKGWWILNRNNMEICVVTDSQNNRLTITEMNSDAVSDAANLVLVPPFNEIEYAVTVNNNVPIPYEPYKVRCSIENINNRILIPIYWKDIKSGYADEVSLMFQYRMIGDNKYPFNDFQSAPYVDHDDNETSSSGVVHFNVTSVKPEEEQRNYS